MYLFFSYSWIVSTVAVMSTKSEIGMPGSNTILRHNMHGSISSSGSNNSEYLVLSLLGESQIVA